MKDKKDTRGFQVPEGYFDQFQEEMEIRLLEEQLPKHPGFSLPTGYLESFPEILTRQLDTSREVRNPAVISLRRPKTWFAISAVAASILLIFWFSFPSNDINSLDAVPLSAVDAYIQQGGMELETNDIAELLSEDDIESLHTEMAFEDASMEAYLLEHIDESTLLME